MEGYRSIKRKNQDIALLHNYDPDKLVSCKHCGGSGRVWAYGTVYIKCGECKECGSFIKIEDYEKYVTPYKVIEWNVNVVRKKKQARKKANSQTAFFVELAE